MKWLLRLSMLLLVLCLCECKTNKVVTRDYSTLEWADESAWLEKRAHDLYHFESNDSEVVTIDFKYIDFTLPDSLGRQYVKGVLSGTKKTEKKHNEVADSSINKVDCKSASKQKLSTTKEKTKEVKKIRDPTTSLFIIIGLVVSILIGWQIYKIFRS